MTQYLKLVHTDTIGGGSSTTTIDLLGGTLQLRENGWETVDNKWEETIFETIDLLADSTDATILTAKATLDEIFEIAEQYASNNLRSDPVWLYFQADGEAAKRALVLSGSSVLTTEGCLGPLLGMDRTILRVVIERVPYWENEDTLVTIKNNLNVLGDWAAIGHDLGTLPQRIQQLKVSSNETGVGNVIQQVWIGIRPYYKASSGFNALWECELGTFTGTPAASANASGTGNNYINDIITSNYTLMQSRGNISIYQVATDYDDYEAFIGKYHVLLRCRINSLTDEIAVQLHHGWGSSTTAADEVAGSAFLTGSPYTGWYLVDLGEIEIPPTGNRDNFASNSDRIANYRLNLYAQRISADGNLDIDCFILIPSEHMVTANGVILSGSQSVGPLYFLTEPQNSQYAVCEQGVSTHAGIPIPNMVNVDYSFHNWFYPVQGGIVVVAGQSLTGSGEDTDLDLEFTLVPRWRTYRTATAT